MFDASTTELLRAVLDEVCENVPGRETGTRTHVATKILEAAARGQVWAEGLGQAGRRALSQAMHMWR